MPRPTTNNWLSDKFPDMDLEDEVDFYNEVLERIIKNPKFYLDNLDDLWVFKTRFIHYYPQNKKPL